MAIARVSRAREPLADHGQADDRQRALPEAAGQRDEHEERDRDRAARLMASTDEAQRQRGGGQDDAAAARGR